MSYLAAPPETPIDIDAGVTYHYVVAQQGAIAVTVHVDSDFEFTTVFGSPATVTVKYVGTVPTTPAYHTVNINVQWPDATVTLHSPQFRVLPTGSGRQIPDITIPAGRNVNLGQTINVAVLTDITADSFSAANLPAPLLLNTSTGVIAGSAPSVAGFYVVTLQANLGIKHYKRYYVLTVGTGEPGGGGGTTRPSSGPQIFYDGDFTEAQLAGPPEFEAPFAADPKPYLYKLKYWQFYDNFSEPALGSAGPLGGIYCGGSPGTIKQIGGGVIEFERQFALMPDSRSEYESHTYSYQIVLVGEQGGITEIPTTTNSRVQFDYFATTDPTTIDLPKAPRAVQILNFIYLLHGWLAVWNSPSGTEVLAQDATLKIWKPGIYERQQRFIPWINYTELVSGSF